MRPPQLPQMSRQFSGRRTIRRSAVHEYSAGTVNGVAQPSPIKRSLGPAGQALLSPRPLDAGGSRSNAINGPNAAYDEAIRALTNALDHLSLQIAHETGVAREFAGSGNRNAAVRTVTVIEPLLQDALGVCSAILTMHRRARI